MVITRHSQTRPDRPTMYPTGRLHGCPEYGGKSVTPKALSLPALLRRIGLLTVAASIAAPALPALATGGGSDKASAQPTVASVSAKGHDPDMMGAAVDPTPYLKAREAYLNAL